MNSSEFAAWAPTIVSIIGGLVFLGTIYGKHERNTERIDDHDVQIEKLHGRMNEADVEIATLKAWRDGYNAAVGRHER